MRPLSKEEQLYAAAYALYEQSDFQEAIALFTQLVLLNTFEEKYWRGLASSHQMQAHYHEALQAWSLVAILNEKDPYSHFHAAECLFSLNDKQEGLKALVCAEERLMDHSLRDKIESLRQIT